MSVNVFVCMGNLAGDPELRYSQNGTPIAGGTVALNRVWTTEDGEKKEEVSFIEFTAFGKTGETISQYFKKGSLIFLQGYLKQERWDDKETGKGRSKIKLIVERFSFTGQRNDDSEGRTEPRTRQTRPQARSPQPATSERESPIDDDDVPF